MSGSYRDVIASRHGDTDESPRVRFSDDLSDRDQDQDHDVRHHRPYPPSLRLNTDLYTIESHVDLDHPEQHHLMRETDMASPQPDPGGPSSSSSAPAPGPPLEHHRRSAISFAEDPRSAAAGHDHPPFRWAAAAMDPAAPFDGAKGSPPSLVETRETLAYYRDWVARQRERRRRWARGPYGRFKTRVAAMYQRFIIRGLLRRRPLPPSADGRHIPVRPGRSRQGKPLLDERTGKAYVSNFIRSSRYTVWDFVPKQLVFQFMKLANFYFLVVAIFQMIPNFSTTGNYTTGVPLLFFVAISMAKEGYDDYRRYKMDETENWSMVSVLDPDGTVARDAVASRKGLKERLRWGRSRRRGRNDGGSRNFAMENASNEMGMADMVAYPLGGDGGDGGGGSGETMGPWSQVPWQDLRVGDIIRIRRDENVPADVVLLRASGPEGVAYIDTMALDGETNLKIKQACPLLARHCRSARDLAACDAEVVSEDPNLDLYSYEGRAVVGGEATPLTMNQVVYRGSTVRNTAEAVGLVINTGEECKIRMNANKNARAKAPAMQGIVNRIVILLVLFVIMLAVGCTIGNRLWIDRYERIAWYLTGAQVPFAQIFFGFVIMFNTLIPLSLYISLEIIKLGQLLLMQDVEMYDPETDTPMVANTTTILENLGQVSYIFSDKTGTLTENKMRFRKMSVAGTAWLHDMDVVRDAEAKEMRERKRKMSQRAAAAAARGKSRQQSGSKRSLSRGGSGHAAQQRQQLAEAEPMQAPLIAGAAQQSSGSLGFSPQAAPIPRRTGSVSHWKSSVRPTRAQPELKTEDLIRYLRSRPHTAFSRKARHFLLCMALCHTCLPEVRADTGEVDFQAASPDELALVQAARDLGYLLVDRPAQSIRLQFRDFDGSTITETYEVLDVIEFSSKRKRMSIIVRMPDGRIVLFSKGADSVILPRLKQNHMAIQKASAVERRASKRKSVDQERAMRRMSTPGTPRQSINLARSSMSHLKGVVASRRSSIRRSGETNRRSSAAVTEGVDEWLTRREREDMDLQSGGNDEAYQTPHSALTTGGGSGRQLSRDSALAAAPPSFAAGDELDGLVDEALAVDEGAVFERCFQHIDDFASEGLRTLLFAYRAVDDDDYRKWKTIYHEATTSLANRQDRIEAAADLIEQGFDLAGATAIEDKLQQGVPETIDKLRRANIKIWMLTGDKRETAINIAHSARLCKPFSEVYILDAEDGGGLQERIASTLVDVGRGMTPHSVVVIDGHTLGVVEADDEMKMLFFDLAARVDSVICCRASPSQKATLVKCIRENVHRSMTLAIGDGANDIAMIQESHVGVGISGREGLQAARIADYSIAQFRFLQRLLLVHGRWNYIRTGKYILATFWKEIVFYLVQALYQRYNGYTGTSLYESWSLTVFNTLFTSLPVILLGIFEKDLRAETLLAVPELYTFGQRNKGFNYWQYLGWMFMGVAEALLIYNTLYGIYNISLFSIDTSLFAMGSLAFTVCVLFINIKMLVLELHNQTVISGLGLFISISGWFVWNIFLSQVYNEKPGPYLVHNSFTKNFGRNWTWWLTGLVTLAGVIVLELLVTGIRRVYLPTDQDLMQEIEKYEGVIAVMREHAAERGEASLPVITVGEADGSGSRGHGSRGAKDGGGGGGGRTSVRTSQSDTDADLESWRSGHHVVEREPGSRSGSRRSPEEYVPPPFTPPAEEVGDLMGSLMDMSSDARAAGHAAPVVPGRRWIGSGPSDVVFTESPIELQSPASRRTQRETRRAG